MNAQWLSNQARRHKQLFPNESSNRSLVRSLLTPITTCAKCGKALTTGHGESAIHWDNATTPIGLCRPCHDYLRRVPDKPKVPKIRLNKDMLEAFRMYQEGHWDIHDLERELYRAAPKSAASALLTEEEAKKAALKRGLADFLEAHPEVVAGVLKD